MTHPTKAIFKWLLSDYVKVRYVLSRQGLIAIKVVLQDHTYPHPCLDVFTY